MSDGALLLDKPVGVTSNRALQEAKRLLKANKAGHAGTLDPLASGLLVVLVGEATKFAGLLLDSDKEYLATLKLGSRTSTGDAEGEVLQVRPVHASAADVAAVLERFRGAINQVPPMHSALKRDGVPLYKLARKGRTVERAARQVRISHLEAIKLAAPYLELRVRCSKGTYIRTLAEDIGEALGTCAHLAALRRTASGRFRLEDAASLEALSSGARDQYLLSLPVLLQGLPRAELDAPSEARFRHGQPLKTSIQKGICAVYAADGSVIGLGEAREDGALRPLRLVAASQAA